MNRRRRTRDLEAREKGALSSGFWTLATLLAWSSLVLADEATFQPGYHSSTLALTNGSITSAPGRKIKKSHLLIRDGQIVAIEPDMALPADAEVIDAEGLFIYPGFVDAGASTLLDETQPKAIEGRSTDISRYAIAGMRTDYRHGLTPEFMAAEHLNPKPTELEKYREAGFVAVHVLPVGRIASGQGAVLNLASLPIRETLLASSTFVTIQLAARGGTDYPATSMGVHAHLRQMFLDAERHALHRQLFANGIPNIERPPIDSALEMFAKLQTGHPKTIFVAQSQDDHRRVLKFASDHQLQAVVWGGREAYRIADRLKQTETDIIIQVDFDDEPKIDGTNTATEKSGGEDLLPELPLPLRVRQHQQQLWRERVSGLATLHRAGVRFAISSRDAKSPASVLKGVRQAIAKGLDRDAALAALTTNPASILGIERDLGTIAVGKPASLIVMTGPFDDEQSKVRHVVINRHRYEYNKESKPIAPSAISQRPPQEFGGTWSVAIESSEGMLRGALELVQVGPSISGRFESAQGNGQISSGKTVPDGIEFVVAIGAGDRVVQLKFAATIQGDLLRGTLKSAFGAATTWTAHRKTPPAPVGGPVQLLNIEVADALVPSSIVPSSAAGNGLSADVVADALAPANTVSTARVFDQPVEFPEDRHPKAILTRGNVLVAGGTVLTATGQTLPKTSILVRKGIIAAIGANLVADPDTMVIDASGRFVMPGIIDSHSHIMIANGLGEVNEATSSIVCEVRVSDVINSSDVSEYRALTGGVTTARLLHGSANCIGGQDAVVQLKHSASPAEHLFSGAPSGVKFALGENVKFQSGRFPNTRLGVEATLNRAFFEALEYRRTWRQYEREQHQASNIKTNAVAAEGNLPTASPKVGTLPPRRDLRLEALAEILDHQRFIHAHCYRADEILMLLRVAENHGLRVWSLQHVLEGYKVAPEIVKHGASCSTFADWWAYKVEAFDATPYNAALLNEAGANVVIKSDDAELMRHLFLEAAKSIRYGNMPPDQALKTITLNPAKELGMADQLGSIEVGKQADLAIFNGHPFNTFSRCEQTLIGGEVYFTRSQQPTAMSPTGIARSTLPPELKWPQTTERMGPIDLSAAGTSQYAIVGATIHPVDGVAIDDGTLLIDSGKIVAIGRNLEVPQGFAVLEASKLHLYPGLIDAGTAVGLIEIGKVRETSDLGEIGQFQPDLRAGIAINPDSELIPVARAGGITTILALPAGGGNMTSVSRVGGGVITGQASVVQLAGWTMPEMVLKMESGLHVIWPSGKNRKQSVEELKRWMAHARLYDRARTDHQGVRQSLVENTSQHQTPEHSHDHPIVDPRYESLRPYVRGEATVFIEAETRQEIVEAVQFAEQQKIKVVLCGATDAWKVTDHIKLAGISVIVGPAMRRPVEDYDPSDAPYANAGLLHEAGIKFCFRSDTASNSRNVPLEAAMAVAYGLPADIALRCVTLTSAEILGVSKHVGSLTVGKSANVILTDGSPLQATTHIKGILIQGKPYQPESRQTRLYEKYRARLNPP
jgi:imidazolonepropionase-like amidohydrolase